MQRIFNLQYPRRVLTTVTTTCENKKRNIFGMGAMISIPLASLRCRAVDESDADDDVFSRCCYSKKTKNAARRVWALPKDKRITLFRRIASRNRYRFDEMFEFPPMLLLPHRNRPVSNYLSRAIRRNSSSEITHLMYVLSSYKYEK